MEYGNCLYESAGKFISSGLWIHPSRRISSYEIMYVTSGEVAIQEENVAYVLHHGDVLLLESNRLHYGFRESENVQFYWLHFHLSPCTTLPLSLRTLHVVHLSDAGYIDVFFNQLIHYANTPDIPAEASDYLLRLILMELVRQKKNGMPAESVAAVRIHAWINANAHMPLTVRNIAEQFGYSEDYVNRLYRKFYGISLKKSIDREKMQAIQSLLLSTNYALKEIAASMGFSDYKYFLKFFQHHAGVSPTAFREMYYNMHMNTNDCMLPYKRRVGRQNVGKNACQAEDSMLSNPKAVIFDLDGTLAYTLPDMLYCINLLLQERGYPEIDETALLKGINEPERECIRICLPEEKQQDEDEIDRCRKRYTELYGAHFCDHTVLYNGMENVLHQLREHGIPLAVNTNKSYRQAIPMVEKLCPGIFERIISEGDYPAKPNPAGALFISNSWNIAPTDIWYVGDSHVDMDTAGNAGMVPIGAAWGYRAASVLLEHGAAAIAHSPMDLYALLGL